VTCIVGIEYADGVLIGGDSAGVGGWSQRIRADEKVFRNGELVFGFTSSFRMGQLLRYKLHPPSFVEDQDIDTYMATSFVDAVRQCLKDGGYARVRDGQESGGIFLVGVRGRLYQVESDFQVGRSVEGYEAIGCGDDLAMGALYATKDFTDWTPTQRATVALEAAAHFSAGVSGPFNFVEASDSVT
jgi:ATP-dependent protease HslVU (ClpYQ) peptidase subunit